MADSTALPPSSSTSSSSSSSKVPLPDDVRGWSKEHVYLWMNLAEVGLDDFADKFLQMKVTGTLLLGLTEEKLIKNLKVEDEWDRQRILETIKALKKEYSVLGQKRSREQEVYRVGATLKASKNVKGVRAIVYKIVQRMGGYYSSREGILINCGENDGSDLKIAVYFLTSAAADQFQIALLEMAELSGLTGVNSVTLDSKAPPKSSNDPGDLQRIFATDYDTGQYNSPGVTLDDLKSLSSMTSSKLDGLAWEEPLAVYQSFEQARNDGNNPYKCHLISKKAKKDLANNENNMIAATWQFHQWLDGLNTTDEKSGERNIPLVKVSFISAAPSATHFDDSFPRFEVKVKLTFRHLTQARLFDSGSKPGTRTLADLEREATFFVEDPKVFEKCLTWKQHDTESKWGETKSKKGAGVSPDEQVDDLDDDFEDFEGEISGDD